MRVLGRMYGKHPGIRELALEILNKCNVPSHDYIKEAMAIGMFVREGVRYVKDALGVEQVYTPATMVNRMARGAAQGDCDDQAMLTVALLRAIGHKCAFCIVKYRANSPSFNHIYVVDYCPLQYGDGYIKVRVALDPIMKDKPMGYEVRSAHKEEIFV